MTTKRNVSALARQPLPPSLRGDGSEVPGEVWIGAAPILERLELVGRRRLLKALGGESGANGAWSVNLMGQPMHARAVDGRVIMAMTPDAAGAAASDNVGIGAKLSAEDLKALDNLDLALWLNAERLFKHFKDMINGFTGMMMMMQGGADPVSGAQAQNLKKSIDMLVAGAKSLTIGVGLDKSGLGLRAAVKCTGARPLPQSLLLIREAHVQSFHFSVARHPARKKANGLGRVVSPRYIKPVVYP